ncbi:lipolytic enzyme G-D-S-L [Patulibacter medicamentivorans]|uniref:Lipolytic enzyme G-D-S-L n=1 Tax=Patulibacter medicamentivorans TaxID=1097667 RepID=H0E6D5_9ACTN|nr:SGNH/GDSL hydrolase family protein [Patulibacter medicamentivorans]EHN10779.1 lipolytic enzyme G-D-S-L [Patulibacter medicamentivorans]
MSTPSTIDDVLFEDLDPTAIAPDAAAALLASSPWHRLVVAGDSVAAGVREPRAGYRDQSWSDRLVAALSADGRPLSATNLGVRGLRVREIHDRQLQAALDHRPDLVVLSAGANDALSRRFDPVALRGELRALLEPLVDSGARVVTIGLFDLPRSGLLPEPHATRLAYAFEALDAITRELAGTLGALHVDSHHHPLAADPGIFSSDLMHANARGHAIAAAEIVRALAADAGTPPDRTRRDR